MSAIETVLRQLDDAWGHPYESVTAVLEGVTDDEWGWEPPGYGDVEREPVWPQPGTVGWHVVHLAACKREYACHVRDRGGPAQLEEGAYVPPPTREGAIEALGALHATLRREIEALSPGDLTLRANEAMPLDEFLAMAIRHDTWHAGQIAVVRRLYRNRQAP